jgi:hypothetical protein
MASAGAASGADVALLNCARGYFSLLIARGSRVVFFRCKSTGSADDEGAGPKGNLLREMVSSMSYYRDKLSGAGVATVFVRSTSLPATDIAEVLGSVGLEEIVEVSPLPMLAPGTRIEAVDSGRIAPCVGATAGRMIS